MAGEPGVEIQDIAAIEILIQAMDRQSDRWSTEISTTKTMLRRYIETHSSNYFSLAKRAFEEIDRDIRVNIKDIAASIAQASNEFGQDISETSGPATVATEVTAKPNYGWMLK